MMLLCKGHTHTVGNLPSGVSSVFNLTRRELCMFFELWNLEKTFLVEGKTRHSAIILLKFVN